MLHAEQALWSPNGRYTLSYQTDGNLVLYGPAGALFQTETGGRAAGVVIMQQDGNLQIHAQGEPVRQVNSEKSEPGAWLVLQDDGNAVIYKPAGGHVWASQTGIPMVAPVQNNQIRPGQGLYPGQSVWSNNGRYALWYQTDGNLVLNGPAGVVKAWNTTDMLPGILIMQEDGHLVLHSPGGRAVRIIGGTPDHPGAFFVLQDNAEAAIYTADFQTKIWASDTGVPDGPVATSPYMRAGEILLPNHGRITSPEGAYGLVYQPDGNLVLSGPNDVYLWDTATDHKPVGVVIMQDDGNLVITSYGGRCIWDTSTHGNPGSFAMVRYDGKFVITKPDGDVIFQKPC